MGLLEAITGGLDYVGDSLAKPGRAVRGVLAGRPDELLAALPFSDSLSLTDPKRAVTGRDLADKIGITSKYSRSYGASAAGSLADVLTDPLSLLGAYTAYRAAPTVGRGIGAAARSLSGLDLLDGIRTGGRALRGLRSGGDGSSLAGVVSGAERAAPTGLPSVIDAKADVPDLLAVLTPPAGPRPRAARLRPSRIDVGLDDRDYLASLLADPAKARRPWHDAALAVQAENDRGGTPLGFQIAPGPTWEAISKIGGPRNPGAAMATYSPALHKVFLNGDFRAPGGPPIWRDASAMQRFLEENRGWLASSHPNALISHELGHSAHRQSVGVGGMMALAGAGRVDDPRWVAKTVSRYAATNPAEFVAEMYSALRGNRTFKDPAVGRRLEGYAGLAYMDRLAGDGLLKGLGLGLAGLAGSHYLANQRGGRPA